MNGYSRAVRDISALVIIAGLTSGTLFWSDDTWPFAQMRMFPGGSSSRVRALALEVETPDGARRGIGFAQFNLRRAEAEGQTSRIRRNPRMLADLAERYNRGVDPEHRIVRIILTRREVIPARAADPRPPAPPPGGAGTPPGKRWVAEEIARWPQR